MLLASAVEASFVAEALAVFETVPQLSAVVGELICTVLLEPAFRSPKVQLSTPLVIVQEAASAPSLLQLVPLLVGKVSDRVTPFATPVPAVGELLTVMVKPIGSPALTGLTSAVFVTEMYPSSSRSRTICCAARSVMPTDAATSRMRRSGSRARHRSTSA